MVSTNDIKADVATLAERAVAMARIAPEDKYAGLADPSLLAKQFPDLDLLDPVAPSVEELERRARAAEAAGLAVKGVTKSGGASASAGIGGMVLVTSTGFCGAYLRSSQGISMTAIAGEGTGMERDYDFSSAIHAADLASPESIGRTAAERAVARVNPRKVATCKVPVVFDPRVSGSLVGHSDRRDQRRLDRAQDQLSEGPDGPAAVRYRRQHRRRSLARARAALAAVRCGGRQRQAAVVHRERRADVVGARFGDRARTRALPPTAARIAACRPRRRPAPTTCT